MKATLFSTNHIIGLLLALDCVGCSGRSVRQSEFVVSQAEAGRLDRQAYWSASAARWSETSDQVRREVSAIQLESERRQHDLASTFFPLMTTRTEEALSRADVIEAIFLRIQSIDGALRSVEELSRSQNSDYEASLEEKLARPQAMAPITPKGHLRMIQAEERRRLVWDVGYYRSRTGTLRTVNNAAFEALGCVRSVISSLKATQGDQGASILHREVDKAMTGLAQFVARSSLESCDDAATIERLRLRLEILDAARKASSVAAAAFNAAGYATTQRIESLAQSVATGKAIEVALSREMAAESAANYAEISSMLEPRRRNPSDTDLTNLRSPDDLRIQISRTVEKIADLRRYLYPTVGED